MKKLLFFISLACYFGASAKTHIRFNNAGYSTERAPKFILMSDENLSGETWEIKDTKGGSVQRGKIGRSKAGKTKHTSHPFNHVIQGKTIKSTGSYEFIVAGEKAKFKVSDQPYAFIPGEILRYIRSMRSASEHTVDHNAGHYGDSLCVVYRKKSSNEDWQLDPKRKMLDLQGGWYDAGDYIKFTLTTAYAAYEIMLAYEIYPELFQTKNHSKTEYNDLLDEAKWGLDYLCKTMADTTEFVIQAGGWLDHEQGNRLPDEDELDGRRECYTAFSPTQMGYTAAALAIGSRLFEKDGYKEDADRYRSHAEKIYAKAKNYSNPAWFQKEWQIFYKDESIYDNLELAAAELYKLTKKKGYLREAKVYAQSAGAGYWSSWGTCNMVAHNSLLEHSGALAEHIFTDMTNFEQITYQTGNVWGLPHEYTWGSLYSFLGVANGGMLYDNQKPGKIYDKMAYNVLDYTLGQNNWGMAMVASQQIPNSISQIYSQVYRLQPDKFPTGAVAEGPGDRPSHEELKKYFDMPEDNPFEEFNTSDVVFYDHNTNFQTMETTLAGLADSFLFFTLINKMEQPKPVK